jgi:hypothetical protein
VQGVGKVADRPAAGRRKRIPGAARSFFHHLARQEQRSSERLGFLVGRGAQEIAFAVVLGSALRAGTRLLRNPALGGHPDELMTKVNFDFGTHSVESGFACLNISNGDIPDLDI